MYVIDALVVVLIVAALVFAGAAIVTRSNHKELATGSLGNKELAHAMRLLDRVRASDDAVPQLPSTLRSEIDRTVSDYYKELEA